MNTISQEQYTKIIECPECASTMKLYVFPSMWAGIQECDNPDCAVYDTCQHANTHTEDAETTVLGSNGEPYEIAHTVTCCDCCGSQIEEGYHYDN